MRRLLCYAASAEAGPLVQRDESFLCVGVGALAAAVSVTSALATDDYDELWLFGVGGVWPARLCDDAISPLSIGELVIVQDDRLGDFGVELPSGFQDLEQMGLGSCGPWPMAVKPSRACARALGCSMVHGVTVASGSATDQRASDLAARLRARRTSPLSATPSSTDAPRYVESMEGAAVALACHRAGVPIVQIRAISNYVGDRERSQWSLEQACAALQLGVARLLEAGLEGHL